MALAAKHSWWEETWRWEIALRVLVLSGGNDLKRPPFWFLACAGSRSPSSYDGCLPVHYLVHWKVVLGPSISAQSANCLSRQVRERTC